jgi:integrase
LNGRRAPARDAADKDDFTVGELILLYLRHCDSYYQKAGKPTGEAINVEHALRPLRRLYGSSQAAAFGPLGLKNVRKAMIDSGLCRNEVNKRVGKIKRAFRWAVSEERIPGSVIHALDAVGGLGRGRSAARESEPVGPVGDHVVDAIQPYVSRAVWSMVCLQRLTGMRSGEVTTMKTGEFETSGKLWVYRPATHKTAHRGKQRAVYLGPQAQAILRPWLRTDLQAPIFSPAEAEAERHAEQRAARRTPVQPSQQDRRKRRPRKEPGDRYSVDSYRRAIVYACQRADVPPWFPHQLRHSAATRLRKEVGIEVARCVLGHSGLAITETYALMDEAKAADAMLRFG